jgi:hypothetical protein
MCGTEPEELMLHLPRKTAYSVAAAIVMYFCSGLPTYGETMFSLRCDFVREAWQDDNKVRADPRYTTDWITVDTDRSTWYAFNCEHHKYDSTSFYGSGSAEISATKVILKERGGDMSEDIDRISGRFDGQGRIESPYAGKGLNIHFFWSL